MKITSLISLLFALLMSIALAAAAVMSWTSHVSAQQVSRVSLSYQVHGHVLSLKSKSYQLFKQFGDALIIGDLDRGKGEAQLVADIRDTFAQARETISLEIEFYGEEEIEELQELASFERRLEQLVSELTRLSTAKNRDGIELSQEELRRLLDSDIDEVFHREAAGMLEEEQREIQETLDEAASVARFHQQLATGFTALALVVTAISIIIAFVIVGRPVRALLSGVRQLDTTYEARPIEEAGTGEIRELIKAFNHMADRLSAKARLLATENRALEDTSKTQMHQLERLVEELKKADANRQRMLADVSHELRTPLTVIRGEADIALRGGDKPAEVYQDALKRTRDAAEHTGRLVDDLLFVARNESGQANLRIGSMDLAKVVQETMALFDSGVTLFPGVEEAPMRGDADRIRQALLILLENARYHGGSEIAIRLARTPNGYRAAVEDNGPGMTDEEKAHAFERFFRGHNAAEKYREGLGLGLSVAFSIAQAHGGSLELADRTGGGLVAVLMLPAQPVLKVVA